MALRTSKQIGVRDPRRLSGLITEDDGGQRRRVGEDSAESPPSLQSVPGAPPTAAPAAPSQPLNAAADAQLEAPALEVPTTKAAGGAARPKRTPAVPLRDEPLVHLAAGVPADLTHRLADVSFDLAYSHPRLKQVQTIVGGLVWSYVDHENSRKLRALGLLLDEFEQQPLSVAPADKRLAARVPVSLKRRVEGSALRLSRTHRSSANARMIVSALVWKHLVGAEEDPERFDALTEMLAQYYTELSGRPVFNSVP